MFVPGPWPPWLVQALWTVATIALLLLAGVLARVIARTYLARLTRDTKGDWDDVLLEEIGKRIPLWAVLLGLHLSQARWPLTGAAHEQAARWLGAVGLASITFAIAAILTRLVRAHGARSAMPVSGLTVNVIRIVITVLGGLAIARSFGVEIAPYLAVLGVGGLAVALAVQDPLSNLFAGLFVSIAGFVRIGDYVKLDNGAEGVVADFNWRSARIRQLADNIMDVPNAKLAQAVVTNFSRPTPEVGAGLDIVVDWSNDLAVVERVALEVATDVVRDLPGAVSTSAPNVVFGGTSDLGVKVSIGFRARSFAQQPGVRHELLKRLHARFAQEGIRWPVPASRPADA